MKRLALAAGAVIATVSASAFAQVYYTRPHTYDPYLNSRTANQECWNPRARHYEGVRPGETQNDLDFSRCRAIGERNYEERRYYGEQRYADPRYADPRSGERQLYKDSWIGFTTECWNPGENRWEVMRPGEIQDSLDRNKCRPYRQ